MLTVHGDIRSGNCLKVRWMLDALGRDYQCVEVDIVAGGSRTPEFLLLNPSSGGFSTALTAARPLPTPA